MHCNQSFTHCWSQNSSINCDTDTLSERASDCEWEMWLNYAFVRSYHSISNSLVCALLVCCLVLTLFSVCCFGKRLECVFRSKKNLRLYHLTSFHSVSCALNTCDLSEIIHSMCGASWHSVVLVIKRVYYTATTFFLLLLLRVFYLIFFSLLVVLPQYDIRVRILPILFSGTQIENKHTANCAVCITYQNTIFKCRNFSIQYIFFSLPIYFVMVL